MGRTHSPDNTKPTMSLVPYPDSESDEDDGTQLSTTHGELSKDTERSKRKRCESDPHVASNLPPLPVAFHDLYSTNARISTSDDPSLHGGRRRAIPHVVGNWPSHIYLEWVPSQTDAQNLHSLIDHVRNIIERESSSSKQKPLEVPEITPSLLSSLGAPLPLHISLSRTLQIRTDDRETFVETLSPSIRKAAVGPFKIRFSKLKWVPNFERNRWFLVLEAERPDHDELNKLLNACNDATNRCGHPGLYEGGKGDGPMEGNIVAGRKRERRSSSAKYNSVCDEIDIIDRTENFHISVAWNLVEPDPEWTALVQDIDVDAYVGSIEASFDVVKAKVGNAVHNIDLGRKSRIGSMGGVLA